MILDKARCYYIEMFVCDARVVRGVHRPNHGLGPKSTSKWHTFIHTGLWPVGGVIFQQQQPNEDRIKTITTFY